MTLFGRDREVKAVREALLAGRNVILCGAYGIGRTSLLRAVAETFGIDGRFLFLDSGRTSTALCGEIADTLFGRRIRRRASSLRGLQTMIATRRLPARKSIVLVLDDIAKLTPPKWKLLRFLVETSRYRLVAITERFLPNADFERLRVTLHPALTLELRRISRDASAAFLADVRDRHGLGWSDQQISLLASASGGYPLGLVEAALRAIEGCERSQRREQ
jgi:replication-associated recombination protein RarA